MEDKNKNPMENSSAYSVGNGSTQGSSSTPPIQGPSNQPIPNPVNATPTPTSNQNIPTPPPSSSSGGKGSTIIVGGILLLFIVIVIALYFLIIRQSYEPDVQITPPPIQQQEPINGVSPTPVNSEEEEVINIELEENLDEEFTPIDQDLNQL